LIRDLADLQRYTSSIAQEAPQIADEIVLREPGISAKQTKWLLRRLPGLASSYLDCVQRFDLTKVALGMIALAPSASWGASLPVRLVNANSPDNSMYEALQGLRAHEVAAFEGDPICVASASHDDAGSMVWLDMTASPEVVARRLASDFESFMILAGRLWAFAREETSLGEATVGVADAQARNWRRLAGYP
jgi:hypothetical protein